MRETVYFGSLEIVRVRRLAALVYGVFCMSKTVYGPDNPHPLSTLKTELVWEGKYDEFGNRRC